MQIIKYCCPCIFNVADVNERNIINQASNNQSFLDQNNSQHNNIKNNGTYANNQQSNQSAVYRDLFFNNEQNNANIENKIITQGHEASMISNQQKHQSRTASGYFSNSNKKKSESNNNDQSDKNYSIITTGRVASNNITNQPNDPNIKNSSIDHKVNVNNQLADSSLQAPLNPLKKSLEFYECDNINPVAHTDINAITDNTQHSRIIKAIISNKNNILCTEQLDGILYDFKPVILIMMQNITINIIVKIYGHVISMYYDFHNMSNTYIQLYAYTDGKMKQLYDFSNKDTAIYINNHILEIVELMNIESANKLNTLITYNMDNGARYIQKSATIRNNTNNYVTKITSLVQDYKLNANSTIQTPYYFIQKDTNN